jgi:hypothetical protein
MKKLALFFLLITIVHFCFAQTSAKPNKSREGTNDPAIKKNLAPQFISRDFAKLWTKTTNQNIYGFIGDQYQRIRVKFISIKKIPATNTYTVVGRSMVKTNICDFTGTIAITDISKLENISYGVDDEYKNKGIKGRFVMKGNYSFAETKGQPHSGTFEGSFETSFYLDKSNTIIYDDIDLDADGYANNEFAGIWKMYDSNFTQRCNWGDFRIPNSGDLDLGAGEFSPNDKYLKYGWQTVRDAYIGNKPNSKMALKEEKAEWWK